jgi:hypothetical protein
MYESASASPPQLLGALCGISLWLKFFTPPKIMQDILFNIKGAAPCRKISSADMSSLNS